MKIYQPERIERPLPGDYGLVRGPKIIRAVDSLCYGWHYDHAVIYEGNERIIEAIAPMVRRARADKYKIQWFGIRKPGTEQKRLDVVRYAQSSIGMPYDFPAWMMMAPVLMWSRFLGINMTPWAFALDPLAGCSPLVAKVYHNAGLDLVDKPILNFVSPDELDPTL